MSGFGNTHQAAPSSTSASAPPSALDIVSSQAANWDALLSPIPDALTSLPHDDSELIDSPSFAFGADIDPTSSTIPDAFTWDAAAHLRSSVLGAPDLHTGFSAGSQAPASSALSSTFSLMPENASGFPGYPYGSYPLLPVLSTGPYDSPTVSGRASNDDMLVATVSPAAVSVSQTSPASAPSVVAPLTGIKPEPVNATHSFNRQTPSVFSRAASMDLDEEDDEDDGDEMDDEDGTDEYKERSRGANGGRNKDSKIGRPASTNAARKSDTASNADGSSKRATNKSLGSKQASTGSDSGASTPAPKRRGGNRIAVADFVPPDVTGLSKREARLVKNRAAAFLSRQRKREEFEQMEIRLAEVLEENARLKSGNPEPSNQASEEVQRLQAMLREAQEREQALKTQLEEQARIAEQAKVEEPVFTVQEALKMAHSPSVAQSPRSEISSLDGSVLSSALKEKDSSRHGPGFNLMVLVFSLTLLSMPHQHQLNMRGGSAQPTRITYEPSGSATSAAFPSLFNNVLERWEGGNRFESLDSIDEDDEMEVEVEPWEQEEGNAASQGKQGSSYVVDFEMPVLADEVGKDDDGKIKVRISPCGVPRPRQSIGSLKANELAWDGTPLPPLEASGVDFGTGSFAADWGSWAGWQDFLSEDIVGTGASTLAPETMTNDEAASPNSDNSRTEENISERWATPPPFEESMEGSRTPVEGATLATVLSGEQKPTAPVDVDVSLSTLPAWSRAMIQAAAGEKLKARIRVSKKSKIAGRTRSSISLGKKKMGLVVKV
ncbi:SubName: Full=Uncharacterized protein {ECO:0000313/EMBL:CCA72161.1} [Serendipita indica DSM 11827]|uniref:BZIP domain-containing protein n=1 Tax=Serendipita indica (strain DSM 11827) TaxID=1109443 RepID=G4TLG8_SERID|nr:SubName: Full=Uncharacterized protein {ECO:0000313/EMBL:CCA72161.1} [Serendipita indica DSM 11827]CCA72161.1 hypothetical protein PIIN_06096 [Serendipita indica DSM 11827]